MAKQSLKKEIKMLRQNQRYIIVDMFRNINEALALSYMLTILKKDYKYNEAGWIIRDAIQEGLVYVDNIDNKGEVYIGLGEFGENTWWERHG